MDVDASSIRPDGVRGQARHGTFPEGGLADAVVDGVEV